MSMELASFVLAIHASPDSSIAWQAGWLQSSRTQFYKTHMEDSIENTEK